MCVKHLFAKRAFLGDLGECHHLEIATLRLHLGSGSVFRQALRFHHILGVCLAKGKYIFKGIQDVGIVQDHNLPIVSSQN